LKPTKLLFNHFSVSLLLLTISLLSSQEPQGEWKVSPRSAGVANPQAVTADSIKIGAKVYVKECLDCHGKLGKGDGPGAKDFTQTMPDFTTDKFANQTDGSLFFKITKGRRPMPAYKENVSDEDRWNVINYIRTLKPKK
jgi:mono/diheme cytochrome c family protein